MSLKAPLSLLYLKLTYQMHTSHPFPCLQHLAHGIGIDKYLWVRHEQVPVSWVPHSPFLSPVKFRYQDGPCTPHGNKSDWWHESTRFIIILLICCFTYWCFITNVTLLSRRNDNSYINESCTFHFECFFLTFAQQSLILNICHLLFLKCLFIEVSFTYHAMQCI